MSKDTRRLCCCAVVSSGDEILLQYKRRFNQWELPGGKLDGYETAIDCISRELAEETGLTWVDGFPIGYIDAEDTYGVVVFHCTHFDGNVMLCEPHKQSAIGWFHELPPNLTDATVAALKFYFVNETEHDARRKVKSH